jgi:predicted metal-dependent phosphoesterase TrpH
VAVSDHDTVEGALRLLEEREVDPARVVVAEELECTLPDAGQWLHVNIYGLTEADHHRLRGLRGDVRDVVAYCRERGLLHVLNHPFQSYLFRVSPMRFAREVLALFTHIEGLNRAASALGRMGSASGSPLVLVGGSDAHSLSRVGTAWTEAEASDVGGFLGAVRHGQCAVGGSGISTAGLVAEVYKSVGTYYGRLYTGRGECKEPAGYAVDLLCATACLPFALGGLPALLTLASQLRQKAVSAVALAALRGGVRAEKAGGDACRAEV